MSRIIAYMHTNSPIAGYKYPAFARSKINLLLIARFEKSSVESCGDAYTSPTQATYDRIVHMLVEVILNR